MATDASIRMFYDLIGLTGSFTLALLIWFGSAIAIALVLHTVIMFALNRLTEKGGAGRDVLNRIKGLTRLGLVLIAMFVGLPVVEMDVAVAETVRHLLQIGVIATIGWIAVVAINTSADYLKRFRRLDVEDNLQARRLYTQISILKRTALTVVILVTAGAILMTFPSVQAYGVSLFASAGAAGLVLGFAARPILASLIAGIQIALTQPIRIDDVVIVEKEWGWVEEITATFVVIRIWDLRRLVVPLSYFIEKPFENWTRESADIIGNVVWYVDYTVPVEAMRAKLNELLEAHPLWNKKVANLQVVEAEERTIKVRALMSARNSSHAWDLRCDIREQMIAWLKEEHPDALPRVRASVYPVPGGRRAAEMERAVFSSAAE